MNCRLDFLQWDNYGATIPGYDGNLLAEYKMMENFLLDTSATNTYDSYTCSVAAQAFLECLDIASAKTLGGSFSNASIFNVSGTNVIAQAAQQITQGRSLLGRLGEQIDTTSSNYFGAEVPCMDTTNSGKNYGDGVINAFDIAALLWVQFGHAPYDQLSRAFWEVVTVSGRDDTRWRCGRSETKPIWQVQIANNYCVAPTDPVGTPIQYQRRLEEAPDATMLPHGHNKRKLNIQEQAALPGAMANMNVDVIEWAVVPSAGRWMRIRFSETIMVTDLFLSGIAVDNAVQLSNAWPPAFGCTTCVPDSSVNQPAVLFQRLIEYPDSGLNPTMSQLLAAQYCAQIVPGSDPTTVLMGNILSVRQQPLTAACPFDIYIWIPERPASGTYVARTTQPFSQAANRLAELGATTAVGGATSGCMDNFGVLPGSTAQDAVAGLVVREPSCERQAPSPPPPRVPAGWPDSPPPAPHIPPPATPPPPPMGCNIPQALNFHPQAVVNDGSCILGGCMDSRAPEYDPRATYNDGSCSHTVTGCTDSTASNYRALAQWDDGSCKYIGCLDSAAVNHNTRAVLPGLCQAVIRGCMEPSAANFYPGANVQRGNDICTYGGCTDATASNFFAAATFNNGTCVTAAAGGRRLEEQNSRRRLQPGVGCMDPAAISFSNGVTTHDPTRCTYVRRGCTDPTSPSHVPSANQNDGTCLNPVYGCADREAMNFDSLATVSTLTCLNIIRGCADSTARTFESDVTHHTSSVCVYTIYGCMYPFSPNYNASATRDDGTCTLYSPPPPPPPPAPPQAPLLSPPPTQVPTTVVTTPGASATAQPAATGGSSMSSGDPTAFASSPPSSSVLGSSSADLTGASSAGGPLGIIAGVVAVLIALCLLVAVCLWRRKVVKAAEEREKLDPDAMAELAALEATANSPSSTTRARIGIGAAAAAAGSAVAAAAEGRANSQRSNSRNRKPSPMGMRALKEDEYGALSARGVQASSSPEMISADELDAALGLMPAELVATVATSQEDFDMMPPTPRVDMMPPTPRADEMPSTPRFDEMDMPPTPRADQLDGSERGGDNLDFI